MPIHCDDENPVQPEGIDGCMHAMPSMHDSSNVWRDHTESSPVSKWDKILYYQRKEGSWGAAQW